MKSTKRKHVLLGFVIVIIIVLLFSVVGVVVLYLGNNPGVVPNTPPVQQDENYNDSIIIYEDPLAPEATTGQEAEVEQDTIDSSTGTATTGTIPQ